MQIVTLTVIAACANAGIIDGGYGGLGHGLGYAAAPIAVAAPVKQSIDYYVSIVYHDAWSFQKYGKKFI